jgi:cytochrome c553
VRRARRIAGGLAAVLAAAALFVVVAPYNVAARLPHLPGVGWLLHTYMHNAARTWSMGTAAPDWADLDDPALLRLGAAHFATGCAPCHGAPGREPARVTRGMRPEPPRLDRAARSLAPRELWWITWSGLKYTGMPAWPGAGREDEPWALAAFLGRLGDLDAEDYRALAFGAAEAAADDGDPAAGCARCHGADGLGRDGTAPVLAGHAPDYLAATLNAYATGDRPSGFMEPVAADLSEAAIAGLARRFAALPPPAPRTVAPAELAAFRAGAALAQAGSREVPSCVNCHGDGLAPPARPQFPHLAGEHRRYLVVWLRLWREEPLGGTSYANVMHEAARWLTDRDIEALATYFASGGDAARGVGAEE